ncbi:MAG: hypothetical protein ABIE94_03895 [archaeon]
MEEDFSKKTVVVLVILTVLLSVFGTFMTIYQVREVTKGSDQVGFAAAKVGNPNKAEAHGEVSFEVLSPPHDEAYGEVSFTNLGNTEVK